MERFESDPLSLSEAEMQALMSGDADTAQDVDGASSDAGKDEAGTEQSLIEQAQAAKAEPEAVRDEFDPRNFAVKTKDGKHEIPYDAFESVRKRANDSASRARQLEEQAAMERGQREIVEQQLADLKAQLDAATKGKPAPAAESDPVTDEDLEALKEAAPELYRVMKGLKDKSDAAEARIAEMRQRAEEQAQERLEDARLSAQSQVEAAIANQPKLVFMREHPEFHERFNQVVAMDRYLLASPIHQNLSISDRIAKALALHEADKGVIQLPGQPTKAVSQDLKPAASGKPPGVPYSLSDLPGGGLPRNSEQESLDGLTSDQLVQKFMSMEKPGDIASYVGKLDI
jgi:hypothetical protein